MNAGEIQGALRRAGFDTNVSGPKNGRYNILILAADAETLVGLLSPPEGHTASRDPVPCPHIVRGDWPEALQLALDAAPDADFVLSCADQWESTGFLSDKQLEALMRWAERRRR